VTFINLIVLHCQDQKLQAAIFAAWEAW
jgi:hypothetical protein